MFLLFACSPGSGSGPHLASGLPTSGTSTVGTALQEMGFSIEHGSPWFAAGDVTGDGQTDLALTEKNCCVQGGIEVRILAAPLGPGRDFESPDGWFIPDPYRDLSTPVLGGDLDGDGIGDLVIHTDDHDWGDGDGMEGTSRIAFGPVLGSLDSAALGEIAPPDNPVRSYYSRLAQLGDLDGNGRDELAVAMPWEDQALFLTELGGTGPYTLPEARARVTDFEAYDLTPAGDLDGDGTTDLLAGDREQSTVSVLFTGGWIGDMPLSALGSTLYGDPSEGSWSEWVLAGGGDIDGDGLGDAVIGWGVSGGRTCVVAPVPLSGSWDLYDIGICWQDGDNFPVSAAVLPDVDGDGRSEVALGFRRGEGNTYVLTSEQVETGIPLGEAALTWETGLGPLAVGDVTGDGVSDLVGYEDWRLWVVPGDALAGVLGSSRR